jgi:hypothetical protein
MLLYIKYSFMSHGTPNHSHRKQNTFFLTENISSTEAKRAGTLVTNAARMRPDDLDQAGTNSESYHGK